MHSSRRPDYATLLTLRSLTTWLRKLDWVTRHEVLVVVRRNRPALWSSIVDQLCDDECLVGQNTPMMTDGVIPLPDGPILRPQRRQLTLEYFGIIKKRR